jgi:hypothetical protein
MELLSIACGRRMIEMNNITRRMNKVYSGVKLVLGNKNEYKSEVI